MRAALLWLRGLLSGVSGRLTGAVVGVGVTIALLAAVGAFTASSAASMTHQAIANVSVDWQILINHGANITSVRRAVAAATPYTAMQDVAYASVPGFELQSSGASQTTGGGRVVGTSATYQKDFPAEFRTLIGSSHGVLLAQQTAANLHARVGDQITVRRDSLPPARVRVDGIVDMPNADAFFQAVGLPPGASPQAPPDNVLIVPQRLWHKLFDPQTVRRPDSTRTQLHVRIAHDLPSDPLAAYNVVEGRAKNVEARIAGSGLIGDNLAAKLLSAQADALYARVLFLFLGLPGVILAVLLTLAITTSGRTRRMREQALLRIRGASLATLVSFGAVEALLVALGGMMAGAIAFFVLHPHPSRSDWFWIAASCLAGAFLAFGGTIVPGWLQARSGSVRASRLSVGRFAAPLWERLHVDFIVLAAAGLAYWQIAANGYQVVVAPEGIPQSTVHYQAFLGPVLFWLGAALLTTRLARLVLVHARGAVLQLVKPLSGALAPAVAASLSRQWPLVTRGIVLVLLAFSFGIATAVFNATYNAQALVDAQLTNGAQVAIAGQTSAPPSAVLAQVRAIPGVIAAEAMMHRFAYVGNDLQDLYAIDPTKISRATPMSNAFFGNADAHASLAALAARPDGVLVSEETVTTYQLHPGDTLMLRLQDARSKRYVPIKFTFIGISREFPTAPHDSFLITNSSYVARATHETAAEYVLMHVNAPEIPRVAAASRTIVRDVPGAHVGTILETQHTIGSSLTSVDLHGLSTLELGFAVLFIAAATGLMLVLGLAERRRTFAILIAIGAKPNQLGAFLWSEALAIVLPGAVLGVVVGLVVAQMLVRVLTGVFDPPPESLVLPWDYIATLAGAGAAATALAVGAVQRAVQGSVTSDLRRL